MNRLIQLAFRDLFMALFAVFFLFFLVPHLPAETEADTGMIQSQGEVIIEIAWPPINIDIDLWVLSGDADTPVGYSNKGARNCNLLRDDLGTSPNLDPLPVNYERIVCRKWENGAWTINVHYYGGVEYSTAKNIPVEVVVKHLYGTTVDIVYQGTTILPAVKVEKTAVRFMVDGLGKSTIIPGQKHFGLEVQREGM